MEHDGNENFPPPPKKERKKEKKTTRGIIREFSRVDIHDRRGEHMRPLIRDKKNRSMWRESVNPPLYKERGVPTRKSRGNGSLLLDFLPAPVCLHPSSPLVALPPMLPRPIYLAFITLKARNAHLESSIDKLSVRYIYIYIYFPIVKFLFLLSSNFFFFLFHSRNTIHTGKIQFNRIVSRRIGGACCLYSSRLWRVMEERCRKIVFKTVGK